MQTVSLAALIDAGAEVCKTRRALAERIGMSHEHRPLTGFRALGDAA